jgi:hypothetical protein
MWHAIALVLAAAVTTGCGGAATVPEPETVTMEGTLIAPQGEPARLCSTVLESYPPQCGEGVVVEGLDVADLPGVERVSGVTFGDLRLTGVMEGDVLLVTEPAEPL